MDAVVLAGDGKWEKRFKLHVLGRRVIDYPLEALLNKGFNTYILTKEDTEYDVPVIRQKSKGIIGAIRDAVNEIGLPLLIVYGDVVADEEFYVSPLRRGSTCSITVVPSVPEERHSTLIETELVKGRASTYVFGGAISIDQECYDEIINSDNLIDALNKLVKKGLLEVTYYEGFWADVDNKKDLLKLYKQLIWYKYEGSIVKEGAEIHPTAQLIGKVVVDRKAYVGPYTVVRGPAYIGEGVQIMGFAYIDSGSLESKSIIEPFSYLQNVSVQPRIKIPSHMTLHDDVIDKIL